MVKSRKSLQIIIAIIFISSITLYTCRGPLTIVTLELINSARIMSDEKLTECFNTNQNDFDSVRLLFDAHPNILEISPEKISVDNKSLHYYTTKNKMYVASDKELYSNELDEIDRSGVIKILKNLKFVRIENYKGQIDFIQATSLAEAKGIIYILDKDKFNNQYYKIKEIKDNWYIYDYE